MCKLGLSYYDILRYGPNMMILSDLNISKCSPNQQGGLSIIQSRLLQHDTKARPPLKLKGGYRVSESSGIPRVHLQRCGKLLVSLGKWPT